MWQMYFADAIKLKFCGGVIILNFFSEWVSGVITNVITWSLKLEGDQRETRSDYGNIALP